MFNKKMLAASMAVAITTGGMVAQSHAMKVAGNDLGQVLLGGGYFVENGYTTDITVVNNRTDAAVKAKVVFRSHAKSRELLDFFIYLSPGDVWRGQLTNNGGIAHMTSADDSVRNAAGTEWGDVDPLDVDFFDNTTPDTNDSTTFGHFEVIGYLAGAGTYAPANSGVTVEIGMDKDDLVTLFDGDGSAGPAPRSTDITECTPGELDSADVISTSAPCSLQIFGEVHIGNDVNRVSYRPTALKNVSEAQANTLAAADNAGYVIANTGLILSTAAESLIGEGWGFLGAERIHMVESALAATMSSFPWESGADRATHNLVSFVTKYRHEGDETVGLCGPGGSGGTVADNEEEYSAPFNDDALGSITYLFTSYDNSENFGQAPGSSISGGQGPQPDKFVNEVNYVLPSYFSNADDSGWANYVMQQRTASDCDYSGVPAVTYTYKFVPSDQRTMMEEMVNKRPNPTYVPLPL